MKGKYLEISKVKTPYKTGTYTVKTKNGKMVLATIRWHGPWRRYVLEVGETIWDEGCLRDVMSFISQKMRERKEKELEAKK